MQKESRCCLNRIPVLIVRITADYNDNIDVVTFRRFTVNKMIRGNGLPSVGQWTSASSAVR